MYNSVLEESISLRWDEDVHITYIRINHGWHLTLIKICTDFPRNLWQTTRGEFQLVQFAYNAQYKNSPVQAAHQNKC